MAKVNMMQLREDPPAKEGSILMGYRVDGTPVYTPVKLKPNTEICRQCEGTGRWEYDAGFDGFERRESCECENCDGEGIVYSETTEAE